MKIAVIANTSWYVLNFRSKLMATLREQGHEVIALAGPDGHSTQLRRTGFALHEVPFTSDGTRPLTELRAVAALRRVLRSEGVDVALTYTPKGNLYSALARCGLHTAQIANISGQGRATQRGGWLAATVKLLYRISLRRCHKVMFQNQDDARDFLTAGLVRSENIVRVPGSGVDLVRFNAPPAVASTDSPDKPLHFLMVARVMRDKGVFEFAQAAKQARVANPHLRFSLLGALDLSASGGVSPAQLQNWVDEGAFSYLGATDDVRPHLLTADCVVLPSAYGEGVPRSLLEAAAMSRPLITTNTAGCRDCVDHGVNGLLCRVRDPEDLTNSMLAFAALTSQQRSAMGHASRLKAEQQFDEHLVIDQYRRALASLPAARAAA
jgi:glycosyltransferase involved in cell wall biosynthesis